MLIPNNIESSEKLVHYLFTKHFKRKIISSEISDLNNREILMPNKGGVSLQRTRYCNENKCKEFASMIPDRVYCGFLLFSKQDFENVKSNYIKYSRPDFEAILKHTPLNENFEYLPNNSKVFVNSPGNPAHSDLIYLNPAQINEEKPNTAIRSFTRKFLQFCTLLIDKNLESNDYEGILFENCN
ncbi:hypothetical protein BTO18_14560 [Polaribacter porphyrae]|uniref:Uncharacterized protein n=1 Tax=Polaribacter porphyrae TaxID=1137780 RepID=A0A2S7WTW4_9FLAO|nr:hypothetical protein BTO18_14560 [Polaribacter porphyrae]